MQQDCQAYAGAELRCSRVYQHYRAVYPQISSFHFISDIVTAAQYRIEMYIIHMD
jgi:hypothetical protein